MIQHRSRLRRRQPKQHPVASSNNTTVQNQQQDEQLPNIRQLNPQQLNPSQVIHLQRTVGNQATQRLLIQRNPTQDPLETTENVSQVIGNIGGTGTQVSGGMLDPMMVNAPNSAPNQNVSLTGTQQAGAVVGIGADSLGVVANTMNTVTGSIKTNKAVKQKNRLLEETRDSSGKSHKGNLDSRYKLADRRHGEGGKQVAEGVTGGLTNIYGIVTNSLQLSSTITNAAAGVMAGVAGGLGILTGLVGMIRDSLNIHKRGKAKKRIKALIDTYYSMANNQLEQMDGDLNRVRDLNSTLEFHAMRIDVLKMMKQGASEEQLQNIKEEADEIRERISEIEDEITQIKSKTPAYEQRMKVLSERIKALNISKRKQGSGNKVASLITNIGGIGVGTLAIIGAATGAAALGPVGWAIGGALFLVTIGMMVGMGVKRAVRASNVTRMNQEKTHIDKYVNDRVLPPGIGQLSNKKQRKAAQKAGGASPESKYRYAARPEMGAGERQKLAWYRQFFSAEDDEKKGWFNKLFTGHDKKKNMSGVTSIGERQINLTDYLERYDKDSAGATTFAGILSGLTTDEGDLDVPNPKFNDKKSEDPTNNPKNIKFRDHIKLMIRSFYPKKGDKIINDIITNANPTDAKQQEILDAAKKLILEKLKLQDK